MALGAGHAENVKTIFSSQTRDRTPTGPNRTNPTGFESYDATTKAVGYHPQVKQMRIQTESAGGPQDVLYCHYAPTTFSEHYVADWKKVPLTGPGTSPVVFRYGQPREWSMKLLFNDLGAPANRPQNLLTTEESIRWLFSVMRPKGLGGTRAVGSSKSDPNSSKTGGYRPPTLLVFLTKQYFRCVLADMTINRLAIHPGSSDTIRAEIDVTFVEFAESST